MILVFKTDWTSLWPLHVRVITHSITLRLLTQKTSNFKLRLLYTGINEEERLYHQAHTCPEKDQKCCYSRGRNTTITNKKVSVSSSFVRFAQPPSPKEECVNQIGLINKSNKECPLLWSERCNKQLSQAWSKKELFVRVRATNPALTRCSTKWTIEKRFLIRSYADFTRNRHLVFCWDQHWRQHYVRE